MKLKSLPELQSNQKLPLTICRINDRIVYLKAGRHIVANCELVLQIRQLSALGCLLGVCLVEHLPAFCFFFSFPSKEYQYS